MIRLICIFTILLGGHCHAAEPRTEHTKKLAEGESAPVAGVEAAAWLAGAWEGEAFGARFEESWSVPSAGSMVGYFKLFDDDGIRFYELMLMTVVDGRLSLRVKHFSADFESWEEKGEYVDFKLVEVAPDALHFSGISFYRTGQDSMEAWIVMRRGDELREEKLEYRRVTLAEMH